MFYGDVFKALNKAKVDYVVYGGLAAILYGVPRTTGDVDLIVKLTPKNIEKLFKVLQKLGYRPKLPIKLEEFQNAKKRLEWYKKKNMLVFSFFHTKDDLKWIDICVDPKINFKNVKKYTIKVGQTKVHLLSLEQLKKLKRKAGRPIDLADLDDLKRLGSLKK